MHNRHCNKKKKRYEPGNCANGIGKPIGVIFQCAESIGTNKCSCTMSMKTEAHIFRKKAIFVYHTKKGSESTEKGVQKQNRSLLYNCYNTANIICHHLLFIFFQ